MVLKNILIQLLFFFLLFTKLQAQFCFNASYLQVDSLPASVVVTDFNNDGNLDLASATEITNNVAVLLGNGSGSFGSPIYTPVGGTQPNAIISADFNNDGKADLATSNFQNFNVSILLGNGNGTFTFSNNCAFGTYYSICSADFNGDGKADLAGTSVGFNKIYVFTGTGTGSFTSAGTYTISSGPRGIISADFNNDGKFDLATSNENGGDMAILLGNGTGAFNAPVIYPIYGMQPIGITSADFDVDGDIDIAIGNTNSSSISVLLNAGNGTFGSPTNYSFNGQAVSLASADLDRDCIPDLVVSRDNPGGHLVFFRGTGNGAFASSVPLTTNLLRTVITADLNKDGVQDLVTGGAGINNYSVGVLLNCQALQCSEGISNYKTINYKLSPNPAHDFIDFVTQEQIDFFLIRNALGENVKSISGITTKLDVSDLTPGCYFIDAGLKDKSALRAKFIKE